MPELPEVEMVRRGIAEIGVGMRVIDATLRRRDVLIAPGDPDGGFSRQRGTGRRVTPAAIDAGDLLVGGQVVELRRRGKQIAIVVREARGERALGVQLGMTGHLSWTKSDEPTPHEHARWILAGDAGTQRTMSFVDPRRFGGLRVFRSLADLDAHWAQLGPDALTIDGRGLHERINRRETSIKAALMDQTVIAGVGNIYADEALFLAKIHPKTVARRLNPDAAGQLADMVRKVLHEALDAGGSTVRDYSNATGEPGAYQDEHRVYGRLGKPCLVCGTTLKGGRLVQRATVWCPTCQARSTKQRP